MHYSPITIHDLSENKDKTNSELPVYYVHLPYTKHSLVIFIRYKFTVTGCSPSVAVQFITEWKAVGIPRTDGV